MTLNEIAKKFPKWSLIVKKEPDKLKKIGIILGYPEYRPDDVLLSIRWWDDGKCALEDPNNNDIQPYGEIDAVKTLIEFAGRLLQDSPATICIGEEDKLKEAINTCEGAFGL